MVGEREGERYLGVTLDDDDAPRRLGMIVALMAVR